jgi:DNA topoisomerase-1
MLRNYITRQGTSYESTLTGQSIISIFDSVWPDLVTPKFTRQVELRMDEVAKQKSSYDQMLEKIRKEYISLHQHLLTQLPDLQNLLQEAFSNQAFSKPSVPRKKKVSSSESSYPCPVCKTGGLVERTNSKTGASFFGCSQFPKCTFTNPAIKREDNTFSPIMYQ